MSSTSSHPASFSELINTSKLPVLVDFWAEWCGPCKTLSPVIQQIAREFKGRLTVVKVNVDQKQDLAREYRVQGIPTLILFKSGQIDWRISGALPYEQLKREISSRVED